MEILELFSGIGGMHYAVEKSGLPGHIVSAVDINDVANKVYAHNFPETNLCNNNIQKFTSKTINKLKVNTILMSPPCQPFTRVGNKKDVDDARSDALMHICNVLKELESVDKILMENVKGFEKSRARDIFIAALKHAGFYWQEFILTPTQCGVPNTRHRYYCIARKGKAFSFKSETLLQEFPNSEKYNIFEVRTIVQLDVTDEFLLPKKVLEKRAWLLDIKHPESRNTTCFTKAYTHYTEGTGSVFCPLSAIDVTRVFDECKSNENDSTKCVALLKDLKLRYFTPFEVARLMSFPESFTFPQSTTNRQKYRLLGNSINVLVVSELLKLLMC